MSWQKLIQIQKRKSAGGKKTVRGFAGFKGFYETLIATSTIAAGLTAVMLLIGRHSTPDFIILVTALTALCGLVFYDIFTRRKWEENISRRLKALIENHDRLVREVACNRSDMRSIKDGMGETANELEKMGRQLTPSSSAEARMLEALTMQLSELGSRPRPEVHEVKNSNILELQMAPPPLKPPPRSPLDEALNVNYDKYSDSRVHEIVEHAVRNQKLDIFLQPVVNLPQRKTRMYEIYTRLRAGGGAYLPASRYLKIARQDQMLGTLDNLQLIRCLEVLEEKLYARSTTPYIININSETLADRGFMGDLVAFLSRSKTMAQRLIFELSQADLQNMSPELAKVMDGLVRLGCRFSMDRVRNRKIDLSLLTERHIRFIKLDADWIIKEARTKNGFSRIARLKKQLDSAGIDLIVEKIENETQVRELLDFNIDFAQGYLFGKPDMLPAYHETLKTA